MEEYPKTLAELERDFSTEEACGRYVFQLRWPDGFVCPRCGSTKAWTTKRGLSTCAGCKHQLSVKAGTIFAGSRAPLTMWFRAIWWVTSQENGASAKGLQRILGLGSYETAWTWLDKLRRAMVRPGRDRLAGVVEVDETYIGDEMVSSLFLTGVECATMRVLTVLEPKREETEMKITTIGLDLAKTVFHMVGLDERAGQGGDEAQAAAQPGGDVFR
jgi:transposase-like protein